MRERDRQTDRERQSERQRARTRELERDGASVSQVQRATQGQSGKEKEAVTKL